MFAFLQIVVRPRFCEFNPFLPYQTIDFFIKLGTFTGIGKCSSTKSQMSVTLF